MRIATPFLLCLFLVGTLAPVPAFAQMPPARVISSIDVLVLSKDTVAVGKVRQVRPGNDSDEVVMAVEQVLKGSPQGTIQVKQKRSVNDTASRESLSRMAVNNARVLILGEEFTPLNDTNLAIPTAGGTLLRGATQVLAYIQQVFRSHPPGKTATFNIPVPKELRDAPLPRLFVDGNPGPPRELAVPVDAQLEAWALAEIRSRGDLYRGFQALRPFQSASNIEFVRGLLSDPQFDLISADYNGGLEVRLYRTRQMAYEFLKGWNVSVDRPVLREEIPRFETLEKFMWSGNGDEERFEKVAALSRNLKDLTITDLGHPSRDQLRRVGEFRSLTRLKLTGSDKAEVLLYVSNLVDLEELIFRSGGIRDNDLTPILSLPKLTLLDLENNRITDAGLRTLSRIPTLKTLILFRTSVTQRGIAEVRALRPDLEIRR